MYGRLWIYSVFGWQAIKLKLLLQVQNIEPCILNLILNCGLSFLNPRWRRPIITFHVFLFWSPKAEIFPRIFAWIWNVGSIWQFKSFCTILTFHWFCLSIKCEFPDSTPLKFRFSILLVHSITLSNAHIISIYQPFVLIGCQDNSKIVIVFFHC